MTPGLILLGQFLGLALACGLNLYATVAVLGFAGRFGLFELPLGLQGLESTVVIITALTLYAIESVADKIAYLDSLWDAVHTFIRPPAAALLALGALAGQSVEVQATGAAAAGAAALAVHGVKSGLRLSLYTSGRRVPSFLISLAEDALALSLVLLVLLQPTAAVALVGISILAVLLTGPSLWRAFLLGIRAFTARVRSFFGRARWTDLEELPAGLCDLLNLPLAAAPPRAARAALCGFTGVGSFRNGWFTITADGPLFLYRSLFRARSVALSGARSVRHRSGDLADALEFQTDAGMCTVLLLKDGPSAQIAAAELQHLNHPSAA